MYGFSKTVPRICHVRIPQRSFQRQVNRPWIAASTGASGVAVRSPDLSSCDNALWDFIKLTVAQKPYTSTEELEEAIRSALSSITAAMQRPFSQHTETTNNSFVAQSVQCLATGWMTGRSIFDPRQRRKNFSSILCVQTGSGAHPASCTMGTGGSFPGAKARPGLDTDHSPPSSAEVENE
jgi:hypothetical protein